METADPRYYGLYMGTAPALCGHSDYGQTPLSWAARYGHDCVVQLLGRMGSTYVGGACDLPLPIKALRAGASSFVST